MALFVSIFIFSILFLFCSLEWMNCLSRFKFTLSLCCGSHPVNFLFHVFNFSSLKFLFGSIFCFLFIFWIQFSSVAQSCPTLCDPMDYSMPGPPCPSPTPRVHTNPCPLSWRCHPTISSSVVPFSSCPQSFPASGSFQMSLLLREKRCRNKIGTALYTIFSQMKKQKSFILCSDEESILRRGFFIVHWMKKT